MLQIQVKEDSDIVKANHGRTVKLEIVYKYQNLDYHGNKINTNFASRQNSVVFRPAGRQEDHQKRRDIMYHNAYRFDLVKSVQQPRATWIHLSDSLPGYGQNEIQLAPKDRINIGFCIYNLNGFVDMTTAAWQHP